MQYQDGRGHVFQRFHHVGSEVLHPRVPVQCRDCRLRFHQSTFRDQHGGHHRFLIRLHAQCHRWDRSAIPTFIFIVKTIIDRFPIFTVWDETFDVGMVEYDLFDAEMVEYELFLCRDG